MIHGIDIYDKTYHDETRIKTFKGSQADPEFLRSVLNEIGTPDIIIDDGSHRSEHVIASFQVLFPALAAGGIYVIEDAQTSYWPEFGGQEFELNDPTCTMGYFKNFIDGVNIAELRVAENRQNFSRFPISEISFLHNLIFLRKCV